MINQDRNGTKWSKRTKLFKWFTKNIDRQGWFPAEKFNHMFFGCYSI